MWFVRLGSKEAGPFPEDRLAAMLRLNQFSSLHQVSRDKIRWESAAPLVQRLSETVSLAETTSTADKWISAAKLRQSARAATDSAAIGKSPNPAQPQTAIRNANTRTAITHFGAHPSYDAVSVQVLQAGKSIVDRLTGRPRILLHPMNISLSPGELTAVIGPSGSGKSTCLGLLTGRSQPSVGRITVFGRDLHREFALVKHSLGAVPQMDAFLTSLKVRTSLFYSACLRLPKGTPRARIVTRVDTVLNSVGLDDCGDRRISQLSGGQLRRLSLAQELLPDPDVLYLDEVTSGLDEQSDAAIMDLLRRLTASGRTIMIITHHLHNLRDNCHKLVVLAAGGYLVFFGSPDEACRSFQVANVTEVMPAVTAMSQNEIVARCEAAGRYAARSSPVQDSDPQFAHMTKPQRSRHVTDYFVLVRRQLAVVVSSPLSTLISLFICLLIGLLLFISFPDLRAPSEPKDLTKGQKDYVNALNKTTIENGNIVFILTISAFFLGCLAGTRELVMERRLFWRESGTEMSIGSYLFSKLFVQTILTCIQASGLGVAVIYLVQAECSLIGVSVANSSVAISGLCTGFFISAASRSEAVATKMMFLGVLPQMILSGALKKDPPPMVELLSQIFITSHYGFQSMCGLFPERIRPPYEPNYSMATVIAMALLHSTIMLAATAFFLKRTAAGEDPSRSE